MFDFTIIFVILGGILITIQNAQNSTLGRKTTFPFAAAVICVLDFVLAVIVWLSYDSTVLFDFTQIPWYAWLGGPINMLLNILIAIVVPHLGMGIVISCLVSMQMITSVLMDNFGIMVNQRPATFLRINGLVLSIFAIILVSFEFGKKTAKQEIDYEKQENDSEGGAKIDIRWVTMFLLALLAGMSVSVSGGMIATFAEHTSGTFAPVIGFAIGMIPVSIVLLIDIFMNSNRILVEDLKSTPWWAYCGCVFNTYFSLITAFLVSKYGASTFYGITIVAQIPTGLVCDYFGLFGVPKAKIRLTQYVGAVLMAVAVVIVSVY
ncbi:hypothetical protein HDV01_003799 [Terramyces sp. JEL0728]|nr:hypothetical protein HDV01_003799 [Terramyces sp. JEL0728]